MSGYCANEWNDVCEFASHNNNVSYPNDESSCGTSQNFLRSNTLMTAGDGLVRNTAAKKYLTSMGNCSLTYEPFDPTVASSPLISFWSGGCNKGNNGANTDCVPVYEVNPDIIDKDPVMNKILAKPYIAWGILINIYNTAVRKNNLEKLKGTKLYDFFKSNMFQSYAGKQQSLQTCG